jgi:hypothetical protein
MRTASSGERWWRAPSRCERNVNPSSEASTFPSSEKAWKPPESVSVACGQRMKAWSPPSRATSSGPGRIQRW